MELLQLVGVRLFILYLHRMAKVYSGEFWVEILQMEKMIDPHVPHPVKFESNEL